MTHLHFAIHRNQLTLGGVGHGHKDPSGGITLACYRLENDNNDDNDSNSNLSIWTKRDITSGGQDDMNGLEKDDGANLQWGASPPPKGKVGGGTSCRTVTDKDTPVAAGARGAHPRE